MAKALDESKQWGKDYTTAPVLVKRVLDTDKDSEIGWALNETLR